MFTISIGVRPFSTIEFSNEQVLKGVRRGANILSTVCGLKFPGSTKPMVYIFGTTEEWVNSRSEFASLHGVEWSAFTYGRTIYFNINQVRGSLDRLAVEAAHELLHTNGFEGAPSYSHTANNKSFVNCLMHPHGSLSFWPCANEARTLQSRYGPPEKRFYVRPLRIKGVRLRAAIDRWKTLDNSWRTLRDLRNASTNVPERKRLTARVLKKLADRDAQHKIVARLNTEWLKLRDEWRPVPYALVP